MVGFEACSEIIYYYFRKSAFSYKLLILHLNEKQRGNSIKKNSQKVLGTQIH